jgi:hypothetical protein
LHTTIDRDSIKFCTYEELIGHAKNLHDIAILNYNKCKKEFLHERDRLHHIRILQKKGEDKFISVI